MKLRRTLRFHGLRRPRIRQSWNKYNLYNLWRLQIDRRNGGSKTFFQQKWAAKALARGYHGEHIKENAWERMFDRRLNSVVDMNPRYMAEFDGAEQAAGRGSGRTLPPKEKQANDADADADADDAAFFGNAARDAANADPAAEERRASRGNLQSTKRTPYMQMTFAPMERRLDIAIFRSLFASSARQARQFVVHGAVQVNGKKMNHPGYLLNPGDMFQVDPERVLFATGAKKGRNASDPKRGRSEEEDPVEEEEEAESEESADAAAIEGGEVAASTPGGAAALADAAGSPGNAEAEIKALRRLVYRAREIMNDPKAATSGKRKQSLRAFVKSAKRAMSQAGQNKRASARGDDSHLEVLSRADELADTLDKLTMTEAEATAAADAERASAAEQADAAKDVETELSSESSDASADPVAATTSDPESTSTTVSKPRSKSPNRKQSPQLTKEERARFDQLLQEYASNPYDPSKPYATPWRPRPFMSPFAFIPRYLEVHQSICSAVYLRHPVARPGFAEVPTPFPQNINQLAHNWYLRRR